MIHPQIYITNISLARNIGIDEFARHLTLESLPSLLRRYIAEFHNSENDASQFETLSLESQVLCIQFTIHPSAVTTYHAPSDYSGINGMYSERIRAVPTWRNGPGRYDTVFIRTNTEGNTITSGLNIGRVRQFFSFNLGETHHCALIHEFGYVDDGPDEDTGMWVVRPLFRASKKPQLKIIPLNRIFRAAHLLPVYDAPIPNKSSHTTTLDGFDEFYVNRLIDYHAFRIAI